MSLNSFKRFVKEHKTFSLIVGATTGGYICYKIGTKHPAYDLFSKGDVFVGAGDNEIVLSLLRKGKSVGINLTTEQAKQVADSVMQCVKIAEDEI